MPAFSLDEAVRAMKSWVTFAGCVLIVAVLYWAQTVIVPIALALLLTFVLNPAVTWLERRIGNVPAVLAAVLVVFAVLGLAGWGLARQMDRLADDLPRYRGNIRAKILDVRGAGKGGSVEKIQQTIDQIKTGLDDQPAARGSVTRPVVVMQEPAGGLFSVAWLGPIMGPLSKAALVLTMVIFMLLERRDLRDRLIGLVGDGQLATTTKAFEEAGARVSRQLLMQSLVNVVYGVSAGVGLYLLGVPYALVWGALGGALRFIPYVGPIIGAGAPIVISLAALPGWIGPLWVVVFFVILELFTNLVLETKLYAGAAGVSQVALLVSVAFWTFLWGPLGLLMATPLTVCLVVMGKHVPGLRFVGALMSDSSPLAPEYGYYQRLLARDVAEAADLIDRHIKTEAPDTVYDALMLPALNYAERDRLEQRLSIDERDAVLDSTRELLPEAEDALLRRLKTNATPTSDATASDPKGTRRGPLRVLGYPIGGASDEIALTMLNAMLHDVAVVIERVDMPMSTAQLIALLRAQPGTVVCFADLPPSAPSKTRLLVKRVRMALPDVPIIVGRWAPTVLGDDAPQALRDAGASFVASTLSETRAYLLTLVDRATASKPAAVA